MRSTQSDGAAAEAGAKLCSISASFCARLAEVGTPAAAIGSSVSATSCTT